MIEEIKGSGDLFTLIGTGIGTGIFICLGLLLKKLWEILPEWFPFKKKIEVAPVFGFDFIKLVDRKIDLKIQEERITYETLKVSLSIVRRGARTLIDTININSRKVCKNGCNEDLDCLEHIGESLVYEITRIIMNSVEENHYAEKTNIEWQELVDRLDNEVNSFIISYIGTRYNGKNLLWETILKGLDENKKSYYDTFNAMLDNCKKNAIIMNEKRLAIENELKEISENYNKLNK